MSVVLLGEGEPFPDEDRMQRTAAELRYPETIFIRPEGKDRYNSRYFSPEGEFDFSGHATVAAFHILQGHRKQQKLCMNMTEAGGMPVSIREGCVYLHISMPIFMFTIEPGNALDALCHAMGMPGIVPAMPVEGIAADIPDILFPVADEAALAAIEPDLAAIAVLCEQYGATGVHAFTMSSRDGHVHCRYFSPLYGIPEEAASIAPNGMLAWYLHRQGLFPSNTEAVFIQGEAMGRPARIQVHVWAEDEIGAVRVGGRAVVLASGKLFP